MKVAAITLTRQGVDICRRIESALPQCDIFVSQKYDTIAPERWQRFDGRLSNLVAKIFGDYEGFVFVMATGIVVRTIAPFIVDKRSDPAIVVVDVTGRFAISLCSGHLGGANELARQLADVLGAIPVVTTGTDVNETLAPDMLAKQLGAEIENWDTLKIVSGMLVDREPVGVFAESNVIVPDLDRFAAKRVFRVDSIDELDGRFKAAVVVSHRVFAPERFGGLPVLLIRPKSLVVGIGCDRGTTVEEIEQALQYVFSTHALSQLSIRNLATYVLKKDEAGLLEFAHRRKLELKAYDREEINRIEHLIPNPSQTVLKYTGVLGVAEPAAMLSAGCESLLVPKVKCGRVTLAVALVPKVGG